jgi:hypothetical protein
MAKPRIPWSLRRRCCKRFGHKSPFPCTRCGVRGEGSSYDLEACANDYMPGLGTALNQVSPFYEYLARKHG